jgi:putative phosphoserine phosphatase/1-acylglycerol-3-phosphate O-acyltransferase
MAMGHTVAVVSSATPYQVEPVSRDLGIEHIICSRYEVKNGEFTGGIVRPLCFGEGKVLAAESLSEKYGIDLDQSFFYTDSDDDIELLERVGHPQPLNPNTKLTDIAERKGWPVRRFKSRGQPHLTDYLRSIAATVSLVPSALAGLPIWALTGSVSAARNFSTSVFADVSSALIGLNLVVRGEQHLWSHRPAVFVFNHQSKVDVVIIAKIIRRDFAGVGKQEIKNTPLIGTTMELAGTVFIDRASASSAIEAMQPLVDAMRHQDKSVVIAPEGTRTITPRLGPFKKGPFHLAIQAAVPVVPIVIHNAGDVAPKGDFVFRPATVEVDVLSPVDTSNWRTETIDEHVAAVRSLFLQTLGQDEEGLHSAKEEAPKKKTLEKKTAQKKSVGKKAEQKGEHTSGAAEESNSGSRLAVQKKTVRKKRKTTGKTAAARKLPEKKTTRKKAFRKKKGVKKAVVTRNRTGGPGNSP